MYNRYIPQSDGTYRRSSHPEPIPAPPRPAPPPEPLPPPPPRPARVPCDRCREPGHPPRRQDQPALGFLKRLLPKDFDAGDLLVVILLLLIAGDECDDAGTALLTLALYLFL